ncbi:histidine phosphatase family protein [Marinobacter xestospongiae]|uniref:Histidine phosphatase family protein n=1 Tax=Marinobacter xestospongiae TaxID=994319 RepID=A0ABU3VWM7_9GAMM|nr:histidine phosphatase family protein [Marinobacter xestospongiae]MDV2078685.1 histidine phosphatase family protein [Marinobacter xestospongiae]
MPRLFAALIRHGDYAQLPDTPSAHQPFALNPQGRAQAESAALAVADQRQRERWQLAPEIDSSEQLRAWQTASIIANAQLGPPAVASFAALAERGLGSAANLTLAQIEQAVADDPRCPPLPADWKSNSHFRLPLPGAESLMQAGERVAQHLRLRMAELAEQASADTVKLFVGHGAAFRHAAHQLAVLSFPQIARLSMYHAHPVLLEYWPTPNGQGRWRHVAGHWKVRDRGNRPLD